MLKLHEMPAVDAQSKAVWRDAAAACRRITPLWDLSNYVAVNPFLGFSSVGIASATSTIGMGLGAQVLPGLDFYRAKWKQGHFSSAELGAAARRMGIQLETLVGVLNDSADPAAFETKESVRTFAEQYDQAHGTEWQDQIMRSIARWCAVYAVDGGDQWSCPYHKEGLFESWIEAARVDRSLEIIGLRGWRKWLASVPGSAPEALAAMCSRLNIADADRVEYFYRLLGRLYGWASFFRRYAWQQSSADPGTVGDLLAILACADWKIADLGEGAFHSPCRVRIEAPAVRVVLQETMEDRYVGGVISSLNPPPVTAPRSRPDVQAIFCIDVRSEPMRRHLETQSDAIETRGFAGFFGVSLDWQPDGTTHSARCPVLLKPSLALRSGSSSSTSSLNASGQRVQHAPSAAFSFVELLGLTYGIKLAVDALAVRKPGEDRDRVMAFDLEADECGRGATLGPRIDLAAGILKNMGLTTTFARIVLLCGHVGQSANNPHAAGLDCGACGGHGGAINARVAAALLNDPAVRQGLASRGIDVPADTHFLPAVHDTSVDRIALLDVEGIAATHAADVDALRSWLAAAGAGVRAERAAGLGLEAAPIGRLDRLLGRRSRDWSEVRPEWGLARNAAFIAARRARSYRVNLDGRSFLHEYDAATDPDASVLTLILSAPMVVASWINLQYFASTVDNQTFGCGNKAIHNRVGSLGVVLGNGGDLRTGLAAQSVHSPDGKWYHQPLRLQVVVEAPLQRIEAVLQSQKVVRELIDNGWVRLFALDPDSKAATRWLPGQGWDAPMAFPLEAP